MEYLPVIAANTVKKDTVTISDKNDNNQLMISIGALAHFYRCTDKSFHLAFSPGVSATLKFDAVNIHLGLSGIFGRENRGIITIGTALRQTTVLRSGLPDVSSNSFQVPCVGRLYSIRLQYFKVSKVGYNIRPQDSSFFRLCRCSSPANLNEQPLLVKNTRQRRDTESEINLKSLILILPMKEMRR